jgi:hypothetical protein|tara:strand:+ start:93 stop:236 length:144 start_codon:yes stop_codon:yes gene_type:complete
MRKIKTISKGEGKLADKKSFVPRPKPKEKKEDKKFKPKSFEDYYEKD